ncbi:hypothetical protein KI387_040440, partial [Taxus chinensis]
MVSTGNLLCLTSSALYLLLLIIVLQAQEDVCNLNLSGGGTCGLNGLCTITKVGAENSTRCSCPPGFDFSDITNPSQGCYRYEPTQLGCNGIDAEMEEIDGVDWPGNDYYHLTDMNKNSCKQACLNDCDCAVAIYANLNGIGNCWKKTLPMRYGGADGTRTALFKVSKRKELDCIASTSISRALLNWRREGCRNVASREGFGEGRHRRVLGDNIQGITKPAVRRLARRGAVKRINILIYEETR